MMCLVNRNLYIPKKSSIRFQRRKCEMIIMNTCISCKNKTSDERCRSYAIKGLAFCGRHVKAKVKRIWHEVNNVNPKIVKIQSLWRGYTLRNRLSKLGKGVLKRSVCHNEEELITMEPISKLDPFSYFSFEEEGKVWAFEFNGICKIFLGSVLPLNPYTRTPLSYDTRRRIRWYSRYLMRHKDPISTIRISKEEMMAYKLYQICQILAENGFEDFRPEYLEVLTREQASVMRSLIWGMLRDVGRQRTKTSRWHRYVALFNNRNFMANYHPLTRLNTMILSVLTDITNPSDEYEFCYIIIAAYYQI
jgi:IQ calmodulin-binding motif